ncbi:MAG TPA: SDR family oxidoreductase [Spirochaetota bacterium]|nr:SDR family oxidoreductase [Spirochaetota bacterium]
MSSFNGKTAVITGAASGIGRELALQMSREGAVIIAADYNKKNLDDTVKMVKGEGGTAFAYKVDISNNEQVVKFAGDVKKKHGGVDILINNAGVTLFGKFEELKFKDFEWIMNINLWGAIYMSKAFLPEIKEKKDSYLVNVASIFGVIGTGNQSAYCATKFGLRGFTEALQDEMHAFPVNVVSVLPGGIKTNIAKNARFIKNGSVMKDTEKLERRLEKIARTTAEKAAADIIEGMKKKKLRVRIGGDARFLDRLQRLMPVKYNRVVAKLF